MVLPEGFGLPPLPYLGSLIAVLVVVGLILSRQRPHFSEDVVLAFAPWMVTGAALHAVYQLEWAPLVVRPLLGTPAVYLTTVVLAGGVWSIVIGILPDRATTALGITGTATFLVILLAMFTRAEQLTFILPVATVLLASVLTYLCWVLLGRVDPRTVTTTNRVGILVIFAHALDGVSTAVGADILGFSERTPLSAAILEFAGTLPTAGVLGVGWLFVLVKLALVFVILRLFEEYVREEPTQAHTLLAVIAAVGLGPGAQNVFLYVVV